MNKLTVERKKDFQKLISDYRQEGYMLITLGDRLAELEKGGELVVIERAQTYHTVKSRR